MSDRAQTLAVMAAILATRIPVSSLGAAGMINSITPTAIENLAKTALQIFTAVEELEKRIGGAA